MSTSVSVNIHIEPKTQFKVFDLYEGTDKECPLIQITDCSDTITGVTLFFQSHTQLSAFILTLSNYMNGLPNDSNS